MRSELIFILFYNKKFTAHMFSQIEIDFNFHVRLQPALLNVFNL